MIPGLLPDRGDDRKTVTMILLPVDSPSGKTVTGSHEQPPYIRGGREFMRMRGPTNQTLFLKTNKTRLIKTGLSLVGEGGFGPPKS